MCGQDRGYLTKNSATNDLFVSQGMHCHDIFSFLSLSLFFYSVYILLSSMNIVALDDLHGEF